MYICYYLDNCKISLIIITHVKGIQIERKKKKNLSVSLDRYNVTADSV